MPLTGNSFPIDRQLNGEIMPYKVHLDAYKFLSRSMIAREGGDLIETCIQLHNFRAEQVGLNQIRNVSMPQWRMNAEDEEIWSNFEDMLFSDQRKKDCVSRFHTYPEFD